MKVIQIIRSPLFGEIRIIKEDNQVYANGKDVALALSFRNYNTVICKNCKRTGMIKHPAADSIGRKQQLLFLNKENVHTLVCKSNSERARQFEDWLYSETGPLEESPESSFSYAFLKHNKDLLQKLNATITCQPVTPFSIHETIETVQIKANFLDFLMDTEGLTNLRETAKEFQLSEQKFIAFLIQAGFLFREPNGTLLPYESDRNRTFFAVKEFYRNKHHGLQTYITPAGRALFALICSRKPDRFSAKQQFNQMD